MKLSEALRKGIALGLPKIQYSYVEFSPIDGKLSGACALGMIGLGDDLDPTDLYYGAVIPEGCFPALRRPLALGAPGLELGAIISRANDSPYCDVSPEEIAEFLEIGGL